MNRKKGELSFEAILGLAFLAIFITTLMAVYQFYLSQNPQQIDSKDVVVSYNLTLENFRTDAKFADSMKLLPDGVEFYSAQKLISTYRFMNGNLYRTDAEGKGSILMNRLEKASFRIHPDLEKLLTVTLLPVDKMQIPFFTSFALRGGAVEP
jgi:hypothetical protein